MAFRHKPAFPVFIGKTQFGYNQISGICPTHSVNEQFRSSERNTAQEKNVKENPETMFQFALPRPLFAFRIQRPAIEPLSRLPRASHRATAMRRKSVLFYFFKGKTPLSSYGRHSPLVPFGETPETMPQYARPRPEDAFRNQRPATEPVSRWPRASHSLCPDVLTSV